MLDKIIPKKIIYFSKLIRLDKPIGFLLLMWPCWFALASLQKNNFDIIIWYIIFFLGSFFMRSAGCIINDIIDINLDKKIKRTKNRPLTSKKISIFESLLFLFFLLILSFVILLNFSFYSILFGILSLPLISIYPFLKRYTYWPQLGLGLIFSWGVFIVSIQFMGTITYKFLFLYIGCVFWTIAYDTIYAYQDREDDIKQKLKSTAVLLGNKGRRYVQFFYSVFFIIIGLTGYYESQSLIGLLVIIILIFGVMLYLNKWKLNSNFSSDHYFKFNNLIGLFVFLYLYIF